MPLEEKKSQFVMFIVAAASGETCEAAGQFVETFNPFAAGGRGSLATTLRRSRAKRFGSREGAFSVWQTSSLKAFTVSIEPEDAPSPLSAHLTG